MKQKLFKNLVIFAMVAFLVTSVSILALPSNTANVANAANLDPWGPVNIPDETGLGDRDPREIAATVINVLLGFLGIIAVIIILIGGFKWMTAGGNEDKVAEARKLIMAGVIGLIIVLASYAIALFVIEQLITATGGTE